MDRADIHLVSLIPLVSSAARVECGPSNCLYFSLGEWPRLPFTARIERAQFHRARSASKKSTWPLPPLLAAFFSILLDREGLVLLKDR